MKIRLLLFIAPVLALASCNNAPQRDFTAEIDAEMKNFQTICEQTYADTSLCDSLKEALMNAKYDTLCAKLSNITDEALAEHSSDSLAIDIIKLKYNLGLIGEKQVIECFDALNEKLKSRPDVKEMRVSMENCLKTSEGNVFTDFEIKQPDGSIVRLSDYAGKGNYCLVDFWASWCGPCRAEIPHVKQAWKNYSKKGLTVLSVAVWDKVEDTRKAAEELGVCWNQIVDAQTIPTEIYGIDGIPHIMLIGPDGVILARGLRGADIANEIAKYL